MKKFLLMGLPGTGKSTTLVACVEFLKSQGVNANVILTDTLINKRINANDPIIQQYEKDYELKILPSIFNAEDPSKVFIKTYGEMAMRNLEERLLVDIIQTSQDDDWRKRPTYMLAAEKSSDGKGWITNAELHRKERLDVFIKNAAIIVSVEKTPFDYSVESKKEEKQSKTLYKSPEEIVREIFTRIKELEQAMSLGQNRINSSPANFFESKSSDKRIDKNQFQQTREWLEKNLKFRA